MLILESNAPNLLTIVVVASLASSINTTVSNSLQVILLGI